MNVIKCQYMQCQYMYGAGKQNWYTVQHTYEHSLSVHMQYICIYK